MKKILLFILLISAIGCSKNDSSDFDPDCEVYAKIDGEDFCSYTGGYYLYNQSTGQMYLQGGTSGVFQFSIANARKGTFTLGKNDNWASYETGIISTRYEAISGSLTIERFENKTVSGRFNFVAEGYDPWEGDVTFKITNGRFNLKEL
jgi:hypothetical protein